MPASTPTKPYVSVVIAVRNGARYLDPAIRSVLGQSFGALELILCDDASTDATPVIAADWARRDDRVRVLSAQHPTGPGAARNRGLDAARGDWIAIVDADDMIHPDRIETLLAAAEHHGADIVADDLALFGGESGRTLLAPLALSEPWHADGAALLAAETGPPVVPVGYLKPMVRRSALGALRYREAMTVGEDFDLLMRLVLSGAGTVILPDAYYLYRRHAASTSHRLSEADVAGMEGALQAMERDFPAEAASLAPALAHRRRMLTHERAFAVLVARIKARAFPAAIGVLLGQPSLIGSLVRSGVDRLHRSLRPFRNAAPLSPVTLAPDTSGAATISIPPDRDGWSARKVAELAKRTGGGSGYVRTSGRAGLHALGFVPGWRAAELSPPEDGWTPAERAKIDALPAPVTLTDAQVTAGRVHIRTPTFRRPDALARCLKSLIDQTHGDWVCEVFDDDPDGSGRAIVAQLGDPRIHYRQNPVQRFASANIDQCFGRQNPFQAEYFCVLEDDNFLLPRFLAANIAAAQQAGVEIVFRNQLVEFDSGKAEAKLSKGGLLDQKLTERRYDPDHFRLAIMADIGVSNGGLFWSVRAVSKLEVQLDCSATLQEYYRTFAVAEPIYVALEPLAVWAENGSATTRDLGGQASWLWRELALKAAIARLRRRAWQMAPPEVRTAFVTDPAFGYSQADRARGLVRSLVSLRIDGALGSHEVMALALRGLLIRVAGRPERSLDAFLSATAAAAPSRSQ
ncbi:MAG: glycosyltransferase [Pseudomonadota bacterium]